MFKRVPSRSASSPTRMPVRFEFLALREKGAAHPIEATGQKLRALFAWK